MADAATLTRNSKAGPTHYETLGVSPNATIEEIAGAFARAMNGLMPRPVATIARLSVAYDTLRDPQKRRAYDASLKPAPKPSYALQWSQTPPKAPALAVVDRLTRPVPAQRPEDVAPFDAEPVSELEPVPPTPEPEVAKPSSPAPAASLIRPEAREPIDPRRHVLMMNDDRADWRASLREDQNAIDWKKVAVAVGWPVLGIAMIGAVAGLAVGMVSMDQQPPDALKVALPPSEPSLDRAEASLLLVPPSTDDQPVEAPKRLTVAPARVPQLLPDTAANPQEVAEATPDPLAPITEPAEASEQPAPQVASARMPLSNQTIARTIGRIGYSCGSVASVEGGASGVFKVTCTSGDTYRASPVRGRYHFRRMGRG